MKRRVFAIVNAPDNMPDVPNGSIVEILLDRCGGFDGFILAKNNDDIKIRFNGVVIEIAKDWLSDFWVA
jgi:hypothetical protein